MTRSDWETNAGFQLPSEFARFERWIADQVKAGIAIEIPASASHQGSLPDEKWYRHLASGEVWRLISPDFPFRGTFEQV